MAAALWPLAAPLLSLAQCWPEAPAVFASGGAWLPLAAALLSLTLLGEGWQAFVPLGLLLDDEGADDREDDDVAGAVL